MVKKTIFQIELEITQIDELFTSYAELLHKVQKENPDLVELAACASILHSFNITVLRKNNNLSLFIMRGKKSKT